MSAIGPERTSLVAPHMSALGGKAERIVWAWKPKLQSARLICYPPFRNLQHVRNVYQRSRDVRDYVLARANGNCEGCASPAPFLRSDGTPYLEPHHLRRLSDCGPDHPAHVIALCPNCHRRVHVGADGLTYNAQLLAAMPTIDPEASA